MRIHRIADVPQAQLCCGCGACAYVAPEAIEMIDALEHGRRPRIAAGALTQEQDAQALAVCPGVGLERDRPPVEERYMEALFPAWGPILGLYEGWAADPEIRWQGSSGGACTALALYCLERAGMHGVLHVAARRDVPYLNETVLSRSRADLLRATGSRYAPASPCDGLQRIESAPAPCAFIGKPCDVAAVRKASRLRPALAQNVGLTVAFFCAGTPSTRGTLELLRAMGIDDPSRLADLRYRGLGWPGQARARVRTDGADMERTLSYEDSWGGILERHRQWRCYVCADHTGELADVAVGDPWYREIRPGEPGNSLILTRTPRGERMLRDAVATGYLVAEAANPGILPASQRGFVANKGQVWSRSFVCRLLGAAAPAFPGFGLRAFWWREMSFLQKARSVVGTIRRIFRRRLRRRATYEAYHPSPEPSHPTPPRP